MLTSEAVSEPRYLWLKKASFDENAARSFFSRLLPDTVIRTVIAKFSNDSKKNDMVIF
ncbi:Uncharacterized protein dnm_020040 [Desulfonema magnum]|uniref:Uncharacterized protein n=1 Tax=Desulfonema magnum TaxID=45655 RepID=A0A975BI79_9BACT|nr:Uncharacterized protein dnm_020040 [Desulfonema magnum]